MNWKTPAEELPDEKKQVIVAWFDGEVTFHNLALYINWDKAKCWSYMPVHPDNEVSQIYDTEYKERSRREMVVKGRCSVCGSQST